METTVIKLDLNEVKKDILTGIIECSQRGLSHSTKWLSELNSSISNVKVDKNELLSSFSDLGDELDIYFQAKSYFDLKEYDRCAFFTKNCSSAKCKFLYFYSMFLAGEKKKIDNMTESSCPPDPTKNKTLKILSKILENEHVNKTLDAFGLYLYGCVLKKLDLLPKAYEVLLEAVHANPLHWGAWLELSPLIPDKEKLISIPLPDHWIKHFFIAHSYLEQLCNDEALDIFLALQEQFENSNYLKAQIAIAYHNRRELEKAIETFKHLQETDPYRLDNLDIYSNLLYVRDLKTELANLAHHAVSVDKYRVETCCVIGNYYSLRSDHAKAVSYFQKALRLNPYYLSAWTLMGHEYMEMKNTNAAIHSYRQAIEVNKRDYRAWYGLGQTYDIIKMPFYSLYYYKQAQQLRPNDSRMLIALGETYEKLDKTIYALKCYHKACTVGDVEGHALIKLAKLYDLFKDSDNAAAAYTEYCLSEPTPSAYGGNDQADLYAAYRYLANYHLKKRSLDDAYTYAYKCLEYEQTKEEGKHILKMIQEKRSETEEVADVTMDETHYSIQSGDITTNEEDIQLSITM